MVCAAGMVTTTAKLAVPGVLAVPFGTVIALVLVSVAMPWVVIAPGLFFEVTVMVDASFATIVASVRL